MPVSPKQKRSRRTKSDINVIKDEIVKALDADHPMTVRQVFYRLVCNGVIDKTEEEYSTTVVRLLTEMRMAKEIPFSWITDSSRSARKPLSHGSFASAIQHTADCYRRNLWDSQRTYVEVWVEKEALMGVLYQETSEWDVQLMPTKGYPSLSFLGLAAEKIANVGKTTCIYYFGDYDPTGLDISRNVESRLRELAPNADIEFERVAVNLDQIESMNLPTRPTKSSDSRSAKFGGGESVELDAIPPATLREMVREVIEMNIDERQLEKIRAVEGHEKAIMKSECSHHLKVGASV